MAKMKDDGANVSEMPRKRGRPAKNGGASADYRTVSRQRYRKFADFAQLLARYEDKTGIMGYWYRIRPRIDNGRIGVRDSAILKTPKVEEMTEEFAARKWGQGVYMLKLHDANRAQGTQEVATTWAEVDDPDMPPVYDVRTLVTSHPDNAEEVQRLLGLGILVRDASGVPVVAGSGGTQVIPSAPPAAPPAAAAAAQVAAGSDSEMDTIGKQVLLKLLDRALPSATPQSADMVLEQSFRIADRLQPQTPPALSIDEIVAAVERRLRPVAGPVGSLASELETYERVENLLSKIGAGRASEAPAAAGDPLWLRMLSPLIEGVSRTLLPLVVQKLAQPTPNVIPMRPAASVPPGAAAASVPAAAAASLPVFLPADAPLMDRLSQVAQLALEKQAIGVEGFRFASWLCAFYPGGLELYEYLDQRGGASAVMGFLAMVPEVQARLMTDAEYAGRLEEWLTDFFSYEPSGAGADEVVETEGAADTAAAA